MGRLKSPIQWTNIAGLCQMLRPYHWHRLQLKIKQQKNIAQLEISYLALIQSV